MTQSTDPKFNPSGLSSVNEIKTAFVELEALIDRHAKNGRRKSIALTNLETAAMYAVKSVVVGDE